MFPTNDQKFDHCLSDANHSFVLPRPTIDTQAVSQSSPEELKSAGHTEFMQQLMQFYVENQTAVMMALVIASTCCILLKLIMEAANSFLPHRPLQLHQQLKDCQGERKPVHFSAFTHRYDQIHLKMLKAASSAPSFDSSKTLHVDKFSKSDMTLSSSQWMIDLLVTLDFDVLLK